MLTVLANMILVPAGVDFNFFSLAFCIITILKIYFSTEDFLFLFLSQLIASHL